MHDIIIVGLNGVDKACTVLRMGKRWMHSANSWGACGGLQNYGVGWVKTPIHIVSYELFELMLRNRNPYVCYVYNIYIGV